ncbi:MAG: phosphopantothenoylcysteine decarboxylase [Planctomycetes bacterium]|nr:phosphopantothenoylcysteine decarboxylase [Planctomycetota bacterium]
MPGRPRLRLVVSAGPTREPLDAVRFLTNASSGRMGFAVAAAARAAGHRVTLVTGPVSLPSPAGVRTVRVVTAREMRRAVLDAFRGADALVMTAAVSDYRPARPRAGKWKKGPARMSLPLVRNPDILAEAGRRKGRRVCVGFAVEDRGALAAARGKIRRKRLDALCLCSPAAFERAAADYRILVPGRLPEGHPGVRKERFARRVVALLEELAAAR